LVDLNTI